MHLNIGLLGVGRLGEYYAEILSHLSNCTLVAIADPAIDQLENVAKKFHITKTYHDSIELINNSDIDTIVIVTPTHTHKSLIEVAAKKGKSIFCEKPLSLSLEEATEAKIIVQKTGVFFQMGFMRRFDAAYMKAKKHIDGGVIGRPLIFKSTTRNMPPSNLESSNPAKTGGLIVNSGIHEFDLARWLMGEIKSVYSIGGVLAFPELGSIGDIDNAIINILFDDGRLGVIDVSRNGVYGYDVSTEIVGTKGTLRINYLQDTSVTTLTKEGMHYDTVSSYRERFGQAYKNQLSNFVENVLFKKTSPITIDDGIENLRVALAATRALETKKMIDTHAV